MSECQTETLQTGIQVAGEDFSFCLPFGAKLTSKSGIITYTAGSPPADGTYSAITFKNGCITAVGHLDVVSYTSNPCAALPTSCSASSSGSGATVSSSSANLSRIDASGAILTTLAVSAGSGVSISGNGTSNSPLKISASSAATKTYINAGNSYINISGSGTQASPYIISHKTYTSRTINGMSFDTGGHLTSYSAPTASTTIKGVVEGDGIETSLNTATGIATISLAPMSHPINKTVTIAGYQFTFDKYNRVTRLQEPSDTTGIMRVGGTCHVLPGLSNSSESFSVQLGEPAYLKVTVEGSNLSNINITVDGRRLSLGASSTTLAVGVSTAIYAAGSHSINISGTAAAYSIATAYAVGVV